MLGLQKVYGAKNPFSFMDLQDVQELANFFERRDGKLWKKSFGRGQGNLENAGKEDSGRSLAQAQWLQTAALKEALSKLFSKLKKIVYGTGKFGGFYVEKVEEKL